MSLVNRKSATSQNFAQVANFIAKIADVATGEIIANEYRHLCQCPWTGKTLPSKISNLSTVHFIGLFNTMKPTTCERMLRKYKELHAQDLSA